MCIAMARLEAGGSPIDTFCRQSAVEKQKKESEFEIYSLAHPVEGRTDRPGLK